MSRSARLTLLFASATILGAVAACTYTVSRYERALAATSDGEKKNQVIARFGDPSVHEIHGKPFLLYASNPCESPCAERLWWEHPVLKGFEAWSVEFNTQGNVIHTTHWVSP